MKYVVIYVHFPICCTLNNCTINIGGLGFDSDLDSDSCTMQDFSIGSDSDFDPLIGMYVIGVGICPLELGAMTKMGTVTIWELSPSPSQWNGAR